MNDDLQALVEKWRERAASYLRSAGTLKSFEIMRDITTATTRAYECMAADRTECADELAALLAQRAQPAREMCGTCADWEFSGYTQHPVDERGSCAVGRCQSSIIFSTSVPEYPSTHGCRAYRPNLSPPQRRTSHHEL